MIQETDVTRQHAQNADSRQRTVAQTDERVRVAVIYGGRSSEHSVSCVSAGAIMQHLDPVKFEVIPVGITPSGVWQVGAADPNELVIKDRQLPRVHEGAGAEIALSVNPNRPGQFFYVSGDKAGETYAQVDVILPVLHGKFGEDGTIQGMFDMAGIPYVGCGVLASAAGMDKSFTKRVFRSAGLAVAEDAVVSDFAEITDEDRQRLGLPVFVKPARGGSSIGVSKVTSWDQLEAAVNLALKEDDKVLVEAQLDGPEVECGVLQRADGSLVASVLSQLNGTDDGEEGFYGFDTKYLDEVVTAQIPAPLDEETTAKIQEMSKQAFVALGCQGLSRVDFFATSRGPVINEINTFPGFTPISMYPQVLGATGIEYADLLDELIREALTARH